MFVEQQEAKIHFVHALPDFVQIHFGLCRLHCAFSPRNFAPAADCAAVEERLAHVDAHFILVSAQPLQLNPHLCEQSLQIFGPRCHFILVTALGCDADLREPCLLNVPDCEFGGAGYEIILPNDWVIVFGGLATFLQTLCAHCGEKYRQDREE